MGKFLQSRVSTLEWRFSDFQGEPAIGGTLGFGIAHVHGEAD